MMFLLSLATEGQECIIEHIVYTSNQLIMLYEAARLPGARPQVPKQLRMRRRGCRAGAKQRRGDTDLSYQLSSWGT